MLGLIAKVNGKGAGGDDVTVFSEGMVLITQSAGDEPLMFG